MTTETSRLTLAVDSRQVRTAAGDLDRFAQAGKRSETATQGVVRQFGALRGTLAGISSGLAVRAILQAADGYNNLNARLRLVTRSATEFAAAQRGVFEIAQGTRSGLTETADLFGNLSRATESLGVSQRDVLNVTQTINQALQVSGASAQGAAAALTQLGQGFASGTLRGEELNSVLEQAPRLARAIADGLGVPIGKLRDLGQAGELTADRVFKALQGSADAIAREFAGLPLTVGSATTQAANALQRLIGVIDSSTGATRGLASAISSAAGFMSELADEIDRLEQGDNNVGALALAFQTISQTVQVLGANVSFVFKAVGREIGAVLAQMALVIDTLRAPPSDLIATARRNWAQFNAISEAVRADGERARRELDGIERRLLGLNNERTVSSDQDARRGRGFNRGAGFINAPTAAVPTSPGKAPKISEAERYLESLRQQLQRTQDLSVVETVLADIQAGRLGKVNAAQKDALLGVAAQIDAAMRLNDQLEAEQAQFEDWQRGRRELAEEGRRIFEATRTPAEQLAAELDRLNKLLQQGAIDWDTYARATFQAQDAFDESQRKANEQTNKTKDLAKDLGLTFSSAFEDAIVSGRGLRDVLKGLEQDILRIIARKAITEPLGNAIAGALGGGGSGGGLLDSLGSFFGSLFGGGRATGGGIERGRVYRINEGGGPGEIANIGGRQFLLASQSGTVQRQQQAGSDRSITVNVQMPQGADRTTGQQFGAQIARQLQLASSRNN